MRNRLASRLTPGGVSATTLLLGLLLVGMITLPAPARALGGAPGALSFLTPGSPCPGSLDPISFTGRLGIEGGPLSSTSAANVTVNLSYHYLFNDTTKSGRTTFTCRAGSVETVTAADGRFALNASLPADFCTSTECASYTGPFGALLFGAPPSPPAGYYLKVNRTGSDVALSFVEALSAVTLTPGGRLTVSTGAPAKVVAATVAADGSPSPASLHDAWQLTGAGWTFTTTPVGLNATVQAPGTSGPASLSLTVNGSFQGTPVSLPAVTLGLTAVTTSIDWGSLSPTSLDAGSAGVVAISGSGSAGYVYTAEVTPGPGPASQPLACTTNATPGGTVAVLCEGSAIFAVRGSTVPVATLTNGYSKAVHAFPTISVAAGLGFTVNPDPAAAYTGSIVGYDLTVAGGTGTAPFGPACLTLGDGVARCALAPGPSWRFDLPAPPDGTWIGAATVTDAGGANVSVPVTTTVVERPSLSALLPASNLGTAGVPIPVRALLTGGRLPADYWWNLSQPATTVASGTVSADGLLAINVTPFMSGEIVLTLTVRDGLGTTVANATTFSIAPGPATRLSAEAVTGNATAAGVPVAINLIATNVLGDRLPAFAVAVNVTVSGPSGAAGAAVGVNGSAGASFLLGSGGRLALPSSGWVAGRLNLTFASTVAGRWFVVFATAGGTTGGLVVDVSADLDHLTLTHPYVAHPGARTNATLYTIGDRYGNALRSGFVLVKTLFGGQLTIDQVPLLIAHGLSTVWVNYSAPSGLGGTVEVESQPGGRLLLHVDIPSGSSPPLTPVVMAGIALLAIVVGTTGAVAFVVGRRRTVTGTAPAEVAEGELERLAGGRARILTELEHGRTLTLEELRAGLGLMDPSDGEIAEWVGSLVAEGSVAARSTDSGRTVFAAVPHEEPTSPRVELDPEALDRALEAREVERGPDE
jgi:hypothetical protein